METKTKIKAVLFDLDDTLYDYEYAHQKAMKKMFVQLKKILNIPIEMLEIVFEIAQKEVKRQLIGVSASHNRDLYFQKIFEKLNMENEKKIHPKHIILLFKTYWDTFFNVMKSEKSSIKLLKLLKEHNIKTGLVTDSQLYSQLKKMEILGISEYIDVLISSEEAGIEKPHSSPFLLATHKLKVLASECIMVGDNIHRDIEGAKALGMEGVWINRHDKEDQGITYDYQAKTTKELYSFFKEYFLSVTNKN